MSFFRAAYLYTSENKTGIITGMISTMSGMTISRNSSALSPNPFSNTAHTKSYPMLYRNSSRAQIAPHLTRNLPVNSNR
ncbi:hypothetical protein [Bacillus sp. AFS088145]|uniref:hypothetical protein n=1 Tax=Bacillus sp. AFS088145 TaxID=2033514 RepID=UPI0011553537|nr:hypothetical protein [Bacillus sp. AFS088145]